MTKRTKKTMVTLLIAMVSTFAFGCSNETTNDETVATTTKEEVASTTEKETTTEEVTTEETTTEEPTTEYVQKGRKIIVDKKMLKTLRI